MLDLDIEDACFGPMVDSACAEQLKLHTIGSTVKLQLGGKTDPQFGGGPLDVDCELISLWSGNFVGDGPMTGGLSDSFGSSAVIRIKGVFVLVTTLARQMLDLNNSVPLALNRKIIRSWQSSRCIIFVLLLNPLQEMLLFVTAAHYARPNMTG